MRVGLLALALVAGCGAARDAYVVGLEVRGQKLLVEKCKVDRVGDELRRGDCFVESHQIPAPTERSTGRTP